MRLVWAVPCDSCELHEAGTADISGAGFDSFGVESFPATLELTVAVGVQLEENENSEVEIHIIGPGMTGTQSVAHAVTADPRPSHTPGNFVSQVEAVDIEYPVERAGGYVIEVYDSPPQGRNYSFFFSVYELH